MGLSNLRRRSFLMGGVAVKACGTLLLGSRMPAQPAPEMVSPDPLDSFVHDYLRAMNAPGLILGLADRNAAPRTAAFGYANLDRQTRLSVDAVFEIGSISKSFAAIALLQLREEGKLELDRPVLEYLPWLPVESSYGPITVHHLLTHTSGLPDALGLFLSDSQARHVQGFKPGERFHYCNVGFAILGHLVEKLDNTSYADSIHQRILYPLQMNASAAVITNDSLARRPVSYTPFFDDRLYARQGRLTPASNIVFDDAAGCVVSTAADMTRYLHMLLSGGAAPGGHRLLQPESFTLFSKPYIKAEEFSPTASYGYGIAVDELDGHKILRHTGGMVSFASAMHVDLEAGVGAFASINAMQGFRPNAVTQYAVQTLRAKFENKNAPAAPALDDPQIVPDAAEYAGVYRSTDGTRIEVIAESSRLRLRMHGFSGFLERAGERSFVASIPELQLFPFVFDRPALNHADPVESSKPSPITELRYGDIWLINERYTGPKEFIAPPGFAAFTGHYRGASPWAGSVRVVICKGKLWLDGVTPLEIIGGNLFRVGADLSSPERAEFFYAVEGRCRLLKMAGADFWRVLAV